jgi:MurNAc alpha-1-phosphate uridylyltransferase
MTQGTFPQKAMLLAAGLGTRMKPLTDHMPKPMVPVCGISLIDRVLDWMAASGVKDVVVNTHYMAPMLQAHLAGRAALPAIAISHEELLLETGGGIKKALPLLGERPFFSANSDTLCIDGGSPALSRLAQAWDDSRMDALLLLHPREKAIGYEGRGDFFFTDGKLRRRGDEDLAPYVFTGVQLISPRLFDASPDGAFSMNLLYNRTIAADGTLERIGALVHDGNWLHVGDPAGLAQAETWLRQQG